MVRLTKENLQELDKRIDQTVDAEVLLAVLGNVALVTQLRFMKDHCSIFALGRANFSEGSSLLKHGQDGMQFAVKWIHAYCDPPTRNDKLKLDFDLYAAAGQLHEAAIRYSMIWDLMAQLYRGAAIGERDK